MPKKNDLTGRLDTLVATRKTNLDAASEIVNRALSEKDADGNEGRSMTKDEREEVRGLQTAARNAQEEIDILREQLGLSDTSDSGKVHLVTTAGTTRGADDGQDDEERAYSDAFWNMMKFGEKRCSDEELQLLNTRAQEARDLSAGTDADGGYTVPTGFWANLIDQLKAYTWFGSAGVSFLNTATGVDLPFPTSDGTSEIGEQVAENTTATQEDPTFGEKQLKAYLFGSKEIRASRVLIQDSAFDIEGFIMERLRQRLGRIIAQRATTGNGTTQPEGIVTGAGAGVTTAGATAITLDELLDLQHSIDPAYREGGAGWMFHDSILKYLRKLKDNDGRPLWMPSLIEGMKSTLLGDPYTINQNMASTVATTNVTALYGDFSKFYVRTAMPPILLMIDDSLRSKFQYGYVGYQRMSSILTDASAVKKMTQA